MQYHAGGRLGPSWGEVGAKLGPCSAQVLKSAQHLTFFDDVWWAQKVTTEKRQAAARIGTPGIPGMAVGMCNNQTINKTYFEQQKTIALIAKRSWDNVDFAKVGNALHAFIAPSWVFLDKCLI